MQNIIESLFEIQRQDTPDVSGVPINDLVLNELHDILSGQGWAKSHHVVGEDFVFLDIPRYPVVNDVFRNISHTRCERDRSQVV